MSGPGQHAALRAALRVAGRRWRNRRLLEGAGLLAAATVLSGGVAIAVMDAHRFDPGVVAAARTLVYLLAGALALVWLLARVPRSRDARGLARHLERRDPALDALLITAVEVDAAGGESPLAQRLYGNAAAACRDPQGATREDRRALARAARALSALLVAAGVGLALAPAGWRHGAALLGVPWSEARDGMPYAVQALPGSVQVREGSDLAITGIAEGFAPRELVLAQRPAPQEAWTRSVMERAADGRPAALLAGVAAPLEYYLEGEGVRSQVHRVTVQWLPRIARLDHRYRYPQYTGLADREVRDATDIAAVAGTQVELLVQPEAAPARGELVLDGRTRRELEAGADGALRATLSVDEAARYRIELATREGDLVAVTPDHAVTALPDGAPTVAVTRPGGDTRVTPVEEVEVQVQASDDVSVRSLELVLSVNGQPEEVLALGGGATASTALAVHTLYLEDRGLVPGDVISLYARASDGVASRAALTDLQFLEVRPFDRDYSRGRSGGRGGGGAGGDEESLAAQQRDLVVALFRLARDGGSLPPAERDARLSTLADAQRRVRERVEAIVRRLQGRAMVQGRPGYKVMLEEMPKAIGAMLRVEALLGVPDAQQALPPARQALAHLQRADAAFREVRVAASQQGGGGGGRADERDLSRLFELEMDRLRNRYAEVQRSQPEQQRAQVDETLRKLRELARRQREEVERARRRERSGESGGRGAATQQALAQQLEELLRQLERLTRERPSAALDASRRSLEAAARAMRQSAGGGGGQAARDALDRIEQARRELAQDDPSQVRGALDDARRRADSLAQRHEQVQQRIESNDRRQARAAELPREGRQWTGSPPEAAGEERAGAEPGPAGRAGGRGEAGDGTRETDAAGRERDHARELAQDKAQMQADAAALREQLERIGAETASRRPQVSQGARRAAAVMREEDLEGRLARSREELAAGGADRGLERAIGRALDRVRERIDQAARAAAEEGGDAPGGAGAPSAEQLRTLLRDLAALRDGIRRDAGTPGAGTWGRDASRLEGLAGSLDGLRGPVARNPGAAGDLEALIEGVRALAAQTGGGVLGGPRRDALLAALAGVERSLREAAAEAEPVVAAGRETRAPDRYRALVEDYYRRLGREGGR